MSSAAPPIPALRTARAQSTGAVPGVVHEVLRSPGRPLDAATRAHFEPLFGHDFGPVQVHADERAAASASAVGALAYTVGQHVAFGAGQYNPYSSPGRGLIAHELAHTIQQQNVGGSLQRLSLDDSEGPMEREAHQVADQVSGGRQGRVALRAGQGRVQGFSVTKEPAGGCGICYDVAFPGKGPQNAGRVAHTVVQAAFMASLNLLGKYRVVELPFSAPGDENGRLDLAVATPTGYAIGEIKPATPNGEAEGVSDMAWYMEQVAAAFPGSTVTPLVTAIPVGIGLPMPDPLATAAGCTSQRLAVVMMRPGLYGYYCAPAYSELRSTCACRPPVPPPPIRVTEPKDVKVKDDKKKKVDEKEREKDKPIGIPVPAYAKEIAMALAAVAAMAAAASKMKGLVKGRLLAAATAMAVVILLSKGAEASIGPGEDPIETLIKNADATGQSLPDDIKESMRKDPKLRALLEKAAKSGKPDEANREAAENLTRFLAEHRDEFTDEELEALVAGMEGAKGKMPGGALTVEAIKKQIEARKKGGTPNAPPGAGGTGAGSGAGSDVVPAPPVTQVDPKPPTPVVPAKPAEPPKTPAERLVEGMARPAEGGPKFTDAAREKLMAVARAASPPLTDAEVTELLKKMGPGAGKTVDQIVESLQKGITVLRAPKTGTPAKPGDTPGTPAPGADPAADKMGDKIPADVGGQNKKLGADEKSVIASYDKYIEKMAWVQPGRTFIAFPDPSYETGKSYMLRYLGRNAKGVPFIGQVSVKIGAKKGDRWDVTIAAGAKLYTTGRFYGPTSVINDTVDIPDHLKVGAKPKGTP